MNVRGVVWVGVMGLVMGGVAWAAPQADRQHKWEFGPDAYYFRYREPNVDVTFDGPMVGLAGAFAHHHPNRLMFKAEGRGAVGQVNYSSRDTGSIDGISDFALEGRLAAGYDLPVRDSRRLTPFFGVGYRYLNDDSSGKTSTTGAKGYERESNYFYSPLGVEYSAPLNGQWRMAITGEYDIFWRGQQESHLEDVNPGFNTLSNTQTRGYGARGSVTFSKTGERVDWVIAPFIRWWSIRDSKNANVTFAGAIVGYGYEPQNDTLEVGGAITVRF